MGERRISTCLSLTVDRRPRLLKAAKSGAQEAAMKTALVTGASSGIGAAIARRLVDDGYRVFAGARRTARMTALAETGAVVLPLDVTDDASMVAAMDVVKAESGAVDVLVNNAGYGSYGSLEEVPIAEGRRQFEVNVFGLTRLTQLVLPEMRDRRSGAIVNISSMGGKIYEPFGSWYHATKFAVEGMSDCLRLELEPFGIRVIVIEPGGIRSEWGRISHDNLLAHSGDGPYARPARAHARVLAAADTSWIVSPPEVVAATVSRALKARRPRTRYATGGGAKPILYLRKILPDRAFDRVLRLLFRTA
jgi:NAD(P)-dependent dehydrogenase (short-subunit alcohol dehydrogenase family)